MNGPHVFNGSVPTARLSAAIDSGRAGHMLPILEAVRDFGCGWATIPQHAGRFKIPSDRPTIGVIGDDMFEALGVGAFHRKSLRRFVATCAGGVLVSCAPELRLYAAAAVVAAERRRNAVVVETRPEREAEWLEFLQETNPTMRLVVGTVRPAGGAALMGGSFARGQRRRRISDMLSGGLDRSLEVDRRFFERFPERRHRIRLASQSEVEGLAVAYGAKATRLQAGERWFAVVRWLSDGVWLKAYIPNRAGEECDVPEAWAAALYARLATRDGGIADLEAATRRIAAMGGRA